MNGSANSSVKFPPSKKVNKGAKAIKEAATEKKLLHFNLAIVYKNTKIKKMVINSI